MKNIIISLVLLNAIIFAQLQSFFIDSRDGKLYRTTKIGKQTWMAENLNYDTTGSNCHGDSISYCDKYGRLYDWETAMKVCPSGWHLPNNEEWTALIKFAGGEKKAGIKLKATSGWDEYKYKCDFETCPGNGTDNYGFAALPGGWNTKRDSLTAPMNIGRDGYWWSATKCDITQGSTKTCPDNYYVYMWSMYNVISSVRNYTGNTFTSLYSVRCLKN